MRKCNATRTDTNKTYYNDHHQKPEVISHRHEYITKLRKLQKRMRLWKVLLEAEQSRYMQKREWSPYKEAMPVGEQCKLEGKVVYAHHIDDQGGWENTMPDDHDDDDDGCNCDGSEGGVVIASVHGEESEDSSVESSEDDDDEQGDSTDSDESDMPPWG